MTGAFTKLTNIAYSLFLVILVSYCSGSSKKVNQVSTDANKPRVYSVSISNMKFQPEVIEVNKGDTVIWVNNDMVAHDVAEFPDKKWNSSEIPSGGSWKLAVTQSSDYYCSIHPVMKGKIVMK